jgi:hypothetical protein
VWAQAAPTLPRRAAWQSAAKAPRPCVNTETAMYIHQVHTLPSLSECSPSHAHGHVHKLCTRHQPRKKQHNQYTLQSTQHGISMCFRVQHFNVQRGAVPGSVDLGLSLSVSLGLHVPIVVVRVKVRGNALSGWISAVSPECARSAAEARPWSVRPAWKGRTQTWFEAKEVRFSAL